MPDELADQDRWVRHSAAKVPMQSSTGRNAGSTWPSTWSSYEEARRSRHGVGMGFVLNGDGIVCLDLDHCIEDGQLTGWAAALLADCPDTYVEVSMSGAGLHVWGRAEVSMGRVIRDGRAVEVYGTGRYIAVTGRRWADAPLALGDLSCVVRELVG